MDKGEIVECDAPHVLLQNSAGALSELVRVTGCREHELRKLAEAVSVNIIKRWCCGDFLGCLQCVWQKRTMLVGTPMRAYTNLMFAIFFGLKN